MKTVTCENFAVHGSYPNGVDLLLFAGKFPLRKRSGSRVIHVQALDLIHFTDGTIQVTVGTKYTQRRLFRLKVCKPRAGRAPSPRTQTTEGGAQ